MKIELCSSILAVLGRIWCCVSSQPTSGLWSSSHLQRWLIYVAEIISEADLCGVCNIQDVSWISCATVLCLLYWLIYCNISNAVPLQARRGPEGSRKLRFPDFVTTAQDGGRLSALRAGHLYPPVNAPGTHFCKRLSQPQGHCAIGRILYQWKIHWH